MTDIEDFNKFTTFVQNISHTDVYVVKYKREKSLILLCEITSIPSYDLLKCEATYFGACAPKCIVS
jgi:hypothetical protein